MYKFTCLDATNEEPSVSDGATTSCVSMYVCFFNFHKYSSVSYMFLQLGLPTFCTSSHNAEWSFKDVKNCVVTCLYV